MVYEYQKTDDGSYICPHCNVVKSNQSTMHMHYKANHDGAMKHKCKACNYETAIKQTLEKHMIAKHPERLEQPPKMFECPCAAGCEFESLTKAGMRSHYLLRHLTKEVNDFFGKGDNGEISCTNCGSDFQSKPAYVYHIVKCLPAEVLGRPEVRKGLGLA
jgi:transcription elongation factor Elf1